MNKSLQKGAIAIAISVLMLSIVLVISISIYSLMIQQIRASSQLGHSVVAIYAAESGAERCYLDYRIYGAVTCLYANTTLDNITDATYTFTPPFNGSSPIISVGNYLGTNRRIEINW